MLLSDKYPYLTDYFTKAVNNTRKSISDLMNIRPEYANLKHGEHIHKVSPEEVKIGDIITHIDGNAITIDIIEDFRISISDETRKEVTFTTKDGREIYIKLGIIERKKLDYEIVNNVGYITIYGFLEDTDILFKSAMDSFMIREVEHIVIDLRGDLGGLVDTVVPMLDYITKDGLIVKLDYKSEEVEDKEIYSPLIFS